jgi:hypothetical protein
MSKENPTNKELEQKIDAYFLALMRAHGVPPEKAGAVVYDVNDFVYKEKE